MNTKNDLPPKPEPKPKPGSVKVVKALYKYTARYPDELSFDEGDILYVYDRSNPDWWKARLDSKSGLIPSNYVEGKLDEIKDPLHEAARRGNLAFLQECLEQKVSSTGLDSMGNTPLYWASQSGHIDCVVLLLNQPNPPINIKNHFGDTPLHGASAKNHYAVVETLLNVGADPSIKNNNGETPEMLALSINLKNLIQKHTINGLKFKVSTLSPEEYEDESD